LAKIVGMDLSTPHATPQLFCPLPEPDAGPSRLLQLALTREQQNALILLDIEGRVLEWLPGARAIFGYDAEEMLGHSLERLFTLDDAQRQESKWSLDAARSYGHAEDERWHLRRDGVRIWATSTTTALRDEAGALVGFLRVSRDRTDMRGHVDTLQQRLQDATRAQGERLLVLGTLAHELRNPLGEIANAGRIVRRVADGNEYLATSAQSIERQVRFIETLVQDLLESTRAAAGKTRLERKPCDLRRIIDLAVETCRGALEARQQALEVVASGPILADVDPTRMQQVVVNLLSNSSKFSPIGGRIWIKANVEGADLMLRVEDQGRGISPEMLPRIFELFTQSAGEGGGAGHGLGLGLGVVKSIVELHGGTVQARSEGNGLGAEFIVRLPMERPV
jgi:PAS domain S-box-containing protein